VSKHWKPGKTTVQLSAAGRPAARPSRIRREPVALNANVPAKPQRPLNYRERELFFGIAGILIFGTLIAAGIIALSIFTVFRDDPAADARAAQFNQCYAAAGPNCVLDGGTIYLAGERVEIAGIDAPKIAEARCDREHDRGTEAGAAAQRRPSEHRSAVPRFNRTQRAQGRGQRPRRRAPDDRPGPRPRGQQRPCLVPLTIDEPNAMSPGHHWFR